MSVSGIGQGMASFFDNLKAVVGWSARSVGPGAAGHLTSETYYNSSGVSVESFSFSYDQAGNMLTALNAEGTSTYAYSFSYDADGHVLLAEEPFDTISFSYDQAGNRATVSDSFGGSETLSYNAANDLTGLVYTDSSDSISIGFTYNEAGQQTSEAIYSSGAPVASVSESYNADGNPETMYAQNGFGGALDGFSYAYNLAGSVTQEVDNSGATTNYTYDATGQLLSADTGTVSQSYSYDAAGDANASGDTVTFGNELTSYVVPAGQPTAGDTISYTYDNEGNVATATDVTASTTWTYGYDNANHMTSAVETHSGTTAESVAYTYDAFGNLIAETASGTYAGALEYAVDGWNPAKAGAGGLAGFDDWAILNGTGQLLTRNIQGNGLDQQLARIDTSNQSSDPAGVYFLITNRLGSVRDVIDTNPAHSPLDTISYDAYGNVLSESNAAYQGMYTWAGYDRDAATKLYIDRARVYDPVSQRWMEQDPEGFDAGDSNLLRYVKNNPLNNLDPSGLEGDRNITPQPEPWDVDGLLTAYKHQYPYERDERLLDYLDVGGHSGHHSLMVWTGSSWRRSWLDNGNVVLTSSIGLNQPFTNNDAAYYLHRELVQIDAETYRNQQMTANSQAYRPPPIVNTPDSPISDKQLGFSGEEIAAQWLENQRQQAAQSHRDYLQTAMRLTAADEKELADGHQKGFEQALETFIGYIPLLGPCAEAAKAADSGNYVGAIFYFGMAVFDAATLGAAAFRHFGIASVRQAARFSSAARNFPQIGSAHGMSSGAFDAAISGYRGRAGMPVVRYGENGVSLRAVRGQNCFAAGTPVLTPEGQKPIEEVRPGDLVLSRFEHDAHGVPKPRRVRDTFVRVAPVLTLQIAGQRIRTTAEHPFFVEGKGWTCAREIRASERLATQDNGWIEVEEIEDTGEVTTVYNLSVEEYHTYFVGHQAWGFAVWVHNADYFVNAISENQFRLCPEGGGGVVLEQLENGTQRQLPTFSSLEELGRFVEGKQLVVGQSNFANVRLPGSVPVGQIGTDANELVGSLPPFIQGVGRADNGHGLLVVNGRAYQLSSGGPNSMTGYAQHVSPPNAPSLAPGFTNSNLDHLEGSACSIIRRLQADGESIGTVQLYINRAEACGGVQGCAQNLPQMLPQGVTMDLIGSVPLANGRVRAADAIRFTGR